MAMAKTREEKIDETMAKVKDVEDYVGHMDSELTHGNISDENLDQMMKDIEPLYKEVEDQKKKAAEKEALQEKKSAASSTEPKK